MRQLLLGIITFRFIRNLYKWEKRIQNRKKLLEIPGYLLDDIGLSKEELRKELKTPFWEKRIY